METFNRKQDSSLENEDSSIENEGFSIENEGILRLKMKAFRLKMKILRLKMKAFRLKMKAFFDDFGLSRREEIISILQNVDMYNAEDIRERCAQVGC